jgi:hypothetical protein
MAVVSQTCWRTHWAPLFSPSTKTKQTHPKEKKQNSKQIRHRKDIDDSATKTKPQCYFLTKKERF